LLPKLSVLYFTGRLESSVKLFRVQEAILLAVGLQHKTLEDMEKELDLPISQVLGVFIKSIRKISAYFRSVLEGEAGKSVPKQAAAIGQSGNLETKGGAEDLERSRIQPLGQTLEDEFAAGETIENQERDRIRSMIDALPLDKYGIDVGPAEWEDAERQVRTSKKSKRDLVNVSVRSNRPDVGKRKADDPSLDTKDGSREKYSKKVKRDRKKKVKS